jgi:4-hydroxybenzoate polyprenyltransferase
MFKLSKILDIVIYSNLYVSIVAASITYVLFKLVNSSLNYVLLIPFFIMFVIYSSNGKTDEREDSISNPKKSIFNKKYNKYILCIAGISYGILTVLSFMKGVEYGVAVLAPFIIGILYSEGIPLKSRKIRLKSKLFLKNLIVAGTWVYVTIIIPLLFLNLQFTREIFFLGFIVFSRLLIDEIFFDIKDVNGDSNAGVKTIPTEYGIAFTYRLLIFLNILFTSIMFVIFIEGNYKHLLSDVVLFTAAYGFFYLSSYNTNLVEINQLSDVVVDGEYIATGLLVYFMR